MNSEQLDTLLKALPAKSYKRETEAITVSLTSEMANLLGTKERKLVRVLNAVVDAISNKLFIENVTVNDITMDTEIQRWFRVNRFENLQRDIWRATVRDSEAYVLVSYEGNAPKYQLVEAYNGYTGAGYIYAADNREQVLYAVNVWYEGKAKRLDIYYPDRIEQYRKGDGESFWNSVATLDWTDTANQPLGIALIRFDIGRSDIVDALQLQRDINEAIVDMIAVSRVLGFPQRYTAGKVNPDMVVNQYGQPLVDPLFAGPIKKDFVLTPGSIPHFNEGTTLGQLDSATPDTTVIDKLLHLVSLVTTVPTFYLDGGEMPSGIALIQAEMRLNTKVESHQGLLTPGIEELVQLSVRLMNTFANTAYAIVEIAVTWASPEIYTIDLVESMKTAQVNRVVALRNAGLVSLEQAVRMLHSDWDDTEVANEVARIQGEDTLI